MNTYLNKKDTLNFLKQCLSTSVKLMIEIDELKQNNSNNNELILEKEQEIERINIMFKIVNDYSGFCGYTKS